jgi:outer membrane protein
MQLLRLSLDQPFGVERPSLPEPDGIDNLLNPGEVFSIAQANQPVIRAADMRISSADFGIKIAKAGLLPTFGLFAGANTVYSSIRRQSDPVPVLITDTIFNLGLQGVPDRIAVQFRGVDFVQRPYSIFNQYVDQFNWSLGGGLSIPIFNRGRITNNIQQAEIAKRQAELNADIQRQNLEQTIQQASLDVKTSYAQYDATLTQVEALEMAFENAEKQLSLGVINSVDFLVAKNNLNRANNDLIRSKYDYIFKSKILDFYAGREIRL